MESAVFHPKKLALIFHSFEGGGVERVFLDLAEYWVKKDYRVDLVVGVKKGDLLSRAYSTGARVVDLGAKRFRYVLPSLVAYFRQERPDAILSGLTQVNLYSLIARVLSRVNCVHVVSERNTLSISSQISGYWWEKRLRLIIRWLYPLANYIVCVSKGVALDLISFTGLSSDKVRVIYNPIDMEKVEGKASEDINDDWFAVDVPVIIGVGRLEKQKDFATLIRAISLVRQTRNIRLLILGQGSQHRILTQLIEDLDLRDHVHLLGFVSNPYPYMRQATALVLSSIYEGFGNVLVEALAVGTPVIATDCPHGPREILMDGKYGILVPIANPQRLAEAICATLDNPPPAWLLRQRAEDFNIHKIAHQYLELLTL